MGNTVVDSVVEKGICIGCGVCAGVCPSIILSMNFNKYGEYNAREETPCNIHCGLCLKVCPFGPNNDNEDVLAEKWFADTPGIKQRSETGYYLNSYYGYSLENNHRAKGASGGLTTWLLETLLSQKYIDHAICVSAGDEPEKLFKFEIFSSAEGVKSAAGSVYYPVELSEVVTYIVNNEGRFAVVGLPCFIKAIRLAQNKIPRLRKRVKYCIGLVCGQMKSKHYTRFISVMAGVHTELSKVSYRVKSIRNTADNYIFEAKGVDGDCGRIALREGVGNVWVNRWFTPQACNYCDDVFAELADVVLMDAWLPEYIKDSKGANLLITRSPEIDSLLKQGEDGGHICLKHMDIERVVSSQEGVIIIKRDSLAYRLYLEQKKRGAPLISKRISPTVTLNRFERKEFFLTERMQIQSRDKFAVMKQHGLISSSKLFDLLKNDLRALYFWRKCHFVWALPGRVFMRAKNLIIKVLKT